jgi:hypothetical protein
MLGDDRRWIALGPMPMVQPGAMQAERAGSRSGMSATGSQLGEHIAMSDVAAETAKPLPQGTTTSRRQVGDAVVASLLVFVQLMLLFGSFTFLGLMVMGTDPCAYQACGDPAWITWAMLSAGVGGAILLLITTVMTVGRIVHKRPAWFVPVIGCLAQVTLVVGCFAMEMQAGPLVH